ncbi:MAG: gentisate 1,2-dioxygenase, partial [Gammaproteobacteria bacterium]
VPRRQFVEERDRAMDTATPTGEIPLDCSAALGTDYLATTPLLLARYLRIRADEMLTVNRIASSEIVYVMHGSGTTECDGETVVWGEGDVMCLPGGHTVSHRAEASAVLFTVCNEPLLALERLQPPRKGESRVGVVHWQHDAIEAHLNEVYTRSKSAETAGQAVQLMSTTMMPTPLPVPSMNLAINTLEPGGNQRPHRHNGVAITLSIHGEGVYSMIEDQRVDWSPGAAQITPATELHSHHNRGLKRMRSLVIQDEGVHFYTRTPGFSWD